MLRHGGNLLRRSVIVWPRLQSISLHHGQQDVEIPPEVLEKREPDMPIDMPDPYAKKKEKCFLCKYEIDINYKNTRLLSQFVSQFSGNVYGRHVTGVCEMQQNRIEKALKKARSCGLMPYYYKIPKFAGDPVLVDPDKPFKLHKY